MEIKIYDKGSLGFHVSSLSPEDTKRIYFANFLIACVKVVAKDYNLDPLVFFERNRSPAIAYPRGAIMAYLFENKLLEKEFGFKISSLKIAEIFCMNDHAIVLYYKKSKRYGCVEVKEMVRFICTKVLKNKILWKNNQKPFYTEADLLNLAKFWGKTEDDLQIFLWQLQQQKEEA